MRTTDWSAIEKEFKEGDLSLRRLGAAHGVTEGAIRQHAKKARWVRKNCSISPVPQEAPQPTQPSKTPGPVEPECEDDFPDPEDRTGSEVNVNQKQLAKIFGVTRQTIANWMNEGLPHWRPDTGKVNFFVSAAVSWVKDNKWTPGIDDKSRKTRAEADMAEMTAQKMGRSLVDAGEAQAAWEDFLSRLKANLRGFPDRVIPMLEEGGSATERLAICRKAMDATLRSVVTQQQAHTRAVMGSEPDAQA